MPKAEDFTTEYLKLIKRTVDPYAEIDSKGNVVYMEPIEVMPNTMVRTVTPSECEEILEEMGS